MELWEAYLASLPRVSDFEAPETPKISFGRRNRVEHPEHELPKTMSVWKNGFACSQCLGRFARRRSQGMVFATPAFRIPRKKSGFDLQKLNYYCTLGGIPCITLERQRFQGPPESAGSS